MRVELLVVAVHDDPGRSVSSRVRKAASPVELIVEHLDRIHIGDQFVCHDYDTLTVRHSEPTHRNSPVERMAFDLVGIEPLWIDKIDVDSGRLAQLARRDNNHVLAFRAAAGSKLGLRDKNP